MSILPKAFGKNKNNAGSRKPEPAGTSSSAATGVMRTGNDQKEAAGSTAGDLDIDIRLDTDLSDFNQRSEQSRFKDQDVDFNLNRTADQENSFIETQVLSINPTRSFSRQIDLDIKKLDDASYITPNSVDSLLSSTYRQLKRPIINNILGKGATVVDNANLVMFTSSVACEGKTFSSINMAMSIAMERDRRVLLIDADVNSPSHHEIFGIERHAGLTDLLSGKVDDISNIILKTNMPSLSLIQSGSRTSHAPELFSSKTMEKLVADFSTRYEDRVVIFDSAPLLLMTEAPVLATHMGQIVLVVEAEKTRHEMVRQSLERLSNKIELLLLNKMHEKNDLGGYGLYGKYEES